uniref:GNAT family N-acetyltransferase n=1 Tax=Teredinibacter franksiae TaxID=2761453 RepID=UPI0016241896
MSAALSEQGTTTTAPLLPVLPASTQLAAGQKKPPLAALSPQHVKPETPTGPTFHRFSESPIWQKQRDFFECMGANAWRQGIVPHYVTSNPIMANAYVEMLMAFWQDNYANGTLKGNEPLYILELGAGSGVFSHAIVTQLIKRIEKSPLKQCKPVLIISDFVQSNLDFAKQHPKLKTYISKGHVDFALLDAGTDTSFLLQLSQTRVSKASLNNPLAVIANYVFDGLTQDLVCVHYGKVFDGYMAIKEHQENTPTSNPLVNEPVYDWRPLDQPVQYYDEELIEHYLRYLDSNPVLIPTGAMRCIEHLQGYSQLPLLVLSADRGLSTLKQLRQQSEPGFASHGSFSLPVNYHALSWLASQHGGKAFVCQRQDEGLALSALLYHNKNAIQFNHTEQAFHCYVEQFNPDDAYNLKRAMETVGQYLGAEQMLAQLRLSRWDYRILDLFYESLLAQIHSLQPDERWQWKQAIQHTWASYYPLGDKIEPCIQIGTLATELGIWGLAKECFMACFDYHQHLTLDDAVMGPCYFNLALCCFQLGEMATAKNYAHKAQVLAKRLSVQEQHQEQHQEVQQEVQQEEHQEQQAQNSLAAHPSAVGTQPFSNPACDHQQTENQHFPEALQQLLTSLQGEQPLEPQHAHEPYQNAENGSLPADNNLGPLSPEQQCEQLLQDITQSPPLPQWYKKECFSAGDITLQPLANHHAPEVYDQTRDPSIAVMTRIPAFDSLPSVEQWVKECTANICEQKYCFAIIHKTWGFIGSVALHCAGEDAFFYFWIGVDYQGEGYGPKA